MVKINNIKDFLLQKKLYFIYLVLFFTLLLTTLKLHGSSVGYYNVIFGTNDKDKNLLLGKPRSIRSDEWSVATPLALSQIDNNFEQVNKDIGDGLELSVIYDAPTNHWSTFFEPYNYGYFFLPKDYAFALKWWLKSALLVISTYLLLYFLTNRNLKLSIAGALFMFFTPFIHWWYAIQVFEALPYMLFVIFFALKVFSFENKKRLIIYTFLLYYFFMCFCLYLYPPFQVPVALGGVFLLLGYILNNRSVFKESKIKYIALGYGVVGILSAVTLFFYYEAFKDIIQIVLNTSYPGKRVVTGGHYTFMQLMNGFYNFLQLSNNRALPAIFGNPVEAANFFMLFLFIIPTTLYRIIRDIVEKRKVDFIFVAFLAYFALSLIWLFIGLPPILAKITLLYLVPENRMIAGVGMMNILFIVYFIQHIELPQTIRYKIASGILAAGAGGTYLYLGLYLLKQYPDFIRSYLIVIGVAGVVFLSTISLLLRSKRVFFPLILMYGLASISLINPVYRSLDPILRSSEATKLQAIEKDTPQRELWAIYDNRFPGEYLVANGMHVLNSTHLYPELDLWKKFDPEKKYFPTYNRYAHVVFKETEDTNQISFTNPAGDALDITINPCNRIFGELGVNLYIFDHETTQSCLQKIDEIGNTGHKFYIYKKIL